MSDAKVGKQVGHETTSKFPLISLLWPETKTLSGRKRAIQAGVTAAFLVVAISAVPTILSLAKHAATTASMASFIRAGIFAAIGIGIYNRSRIAAAAGLLLFGYELIYIYSHGKNPVSVVTLFILLWFVHGIRGSFAHHRLKKSAEEGVAQQGIQPDGPASGGSAG